MDTQEETSDPGNAGGGSGSRPRRGPRIAPWKLIAAMTVAALVILALTGLPVRDSLARLLAWTEGLGVWGPIVVVVAYVAASVFLLPGSILTLGAGFLFGVVKGTVLVSVASTLGACAAFLVGRTIARDWVERKIAANRRFGAIDRAVGREGFRIVLLTRLSPVFPFNLLNYAFGLTKVAFRDYALASWIGMIPGTVMYVYLGSAAQSLTAVAAGKAEGAGAEQIIFWAGLVATAAVVVLVTRIARRALEEAAPEPSGGMDVPVSRGSDGVSARHPR